MSRFAKVLLKVNDLTSVLHLERNKHKKFFHGAKRWEQFAASQTRGSGQQRSTYQAHVQKGSRTIIFSRGAYVSSRSHRKAQTRDKVKVMD